MKKERWKWVDVAKGIAIFLVVFTHAPMFMPCLESMKGIIITVGAFHMPLFFFVYGITCSSKRKSISEWKA
jgi:acyltransferase